MTSACPVKVEVRTGFFSRRATVTLWPHEPVKGWPPTEAAPGLVVQLCKNCSALYVEAKAVAEVAP